MQKVGMRLRCRAEAQEKPFYGARDGWDWSFAAVVDNVPDPYPKGDQL
jgi:hypothetical protein